MTQNYLTTTRAIAEITEYDSTNANDVAWVTDKVSLCNRQVENDTIKFYISYPVSGSDAFNTFADAALSFFQYLWYKKIGNDNLSELGKTEYDIQIKSLEILAKSDVSTNRRPALLTSDDPRNYKIILPSQTNIFAFDDFA